MENAWKSNNNNNNNKLFRLSVEWVDHLCFLLDFQIWSFTQCAIKRSECIIP